MQSKIESVVDNFDFQGSSGSLLQYWNLTTARYDYLTVIGQPFQSTHDDDGLINYREGCLRNNYYLNGPEPNKDIYSFAGQAAHTGVADQRTSDTDDQVIMGQLIVPVYDDANFVGVIELLTVIPKQSYAKEFKRICRLLQKATWQPNLCNRLIGYRDKGMQSRKIESDEHFSSQLYM